MAGASGALIDDLRAELARHGDPARASRMQAYMKSAMPYWGVPSPAQKRIFKPLFAAHPLPGFPQWRDTVLALWRGAGHREERYAAMALTGLRAYRSHQTLETLPIYEEMVVNGAWWDYVDEVAVHRLGNILLRRHPESMKPLMLEWSRSQDTWKRRSSIICQVAFKAETDLELLYACIEPNLEDRQFWLRKAIGWALRAYAWVDPDEVARYVAQHESQLSGLSRREALKNIPKVL